MLDRRFSELVVNALAQPPRETRNAVTRSYFGHQLIVDSLSQGHFPLLLGRQMFYKGVVGELAAFLQGPKSLKDFTKQGCNYWKDWADEKGKLEVDYGNAWLDFNGVNQLENVVDSLKTDPHGRRHLITGWRPDRLKDLSLPCCHYAYQWYVNDKGFLEMIWMQRSVDIMIGLPSDIILAAVWNILMAQTVGLKPGRLHFMLGDCHVYESHLENASLYLDQAMSINTPVRPTWELDKQATVFNFVPSMLKIHNYKPLEAIAFKIEV